MTTKTSPVQQVSRCPACNPMYGSSGGIMHSSNPSARGKKICCSLCRGTKRVLVEIARRYAEAIQTDQDHDHIRSESELNWTSTGRISRRYVK